MVQVHHAPPTFTPEDAQRILADHYDLTGVVAALPSERDQNFTLTTAAGHRYVLKLSHANESSGVLDFQHRILDHLSVHVPELQFPRVVPARSGARVFPVAGSDGVEHLVRVLTFVDGRVWAEATPHSVALLRSLGRAVARVDQALMPLEKGDTGATPSDLKWDLTRALWIRRHLDELSAERRALVERRLATYERDVLPQLTSFPSGLLYNDANDHNVLVRPFGNDAVVSGLIDFGDMVYGPRVCDLAIALTYAVMGSAAPVAAAAHVVAGYDSVLPLSDAELSSVLPLICTRLCVSVTNAALQARLTPDNAYLQISSAPAWRLLDQLEATDPAFVVDTLAAACGRLVSVSEPARRTQADRDHVMAARNRYLGPSLSLAYDTPLHIVRGFMQHLYDADGRQYLDAVNNVPHVGHCHPRVVHAGQAQMAVLNTNTRYLHDNISRYAERLCATLPEPLSVCFFVNSGSEAGELALRLARTHTGSRATIVLDHAYHGNTASLVEISPYKYDGPGGQGQPAWVRKVPMPDVYRGLHRGHSKDTGLAYARYVRGAIDDLTTAGLTRPTFLTESLMGSSGQIVLPQGFLQEAYRSVREANGVCVADEVQVGFGRVGTHFWGFATHDVVPDIVILGKPMGNGHPMGAVITTPEIAASFHNGMEYFSTFGGNPVSCAIGLAVLDVLEDESLQAHALTTGASLRRGLEELAERHALIGDVRGQGLFLGVEFVTDRAERRPAATQTRALCNRLKDLGVLTSVDGPSHNVLKIKPPLVFTESDVGRFVEALDLALSERADPGGL